MGDNELRSSIGRLDKTTSDIEKFKSTSKEKGRLGGRVVVVLKKDNTIEVTHLKSNAFVNFFKNLVLKLNGLRNDFTVVGGKKFTKIKKNEVNQTLKEVAKQIIEADGKLDGISTESAKLDNIISFFKKNLNDDFSATSTLQNELKLLEDINNLSKSINLQFSAEDLETTNLETARNAIIDFAQLASSFTSHDPSKPASTVLDSIQKYYNNLEAQLEPKMKKAVSGSFMHDLQKKYPFTNGQNPPTLLQKLAYANKILSANTAANDNPISDEAYKLLFKPIHSDLSDFWHVELDAGRQSLIDKAGSQIARNFKVLADANSSETQMANAYTFLENFLKADCAEIEQLQNQFVEHAAENIQQNLELILASNSNSAQKAKAYTSLVGFISSMGNLEKPPAALAELLTQAKEALNTLVRERVGLHLQKIDEKAANVKSEIADALQLSKTALGNYVQLKEKISVRQDYLTRSNPKLKQLELMKLIPDAMDKMGLTKDDKDVIASLRTIINSSKSEALAEDSFVEKLSTLLSHMEQLRDLNQRKIEELNLKIQAGPPTTEGLLAAKKAQLAQTNIEMADLARFLGPELARDFFNVLPRTSDAEIENIFHLLRNQTPVNQLDAFINQINAAASPRDALRLLWVNLQSAQKTQSEEIEQLTNLHEAASANREVLRPTKELEADLKQKAIKLGILKEKETVSVLEDKKAKGKISDQHWQIIRPFIEAINIRGNADYKNPLRAYNQSASEYTTASSQLSIYERNNEAISPLRDEIAFIALLQSEHKALEADQRQVSVAEKMHDEPAIFKNAKDEELKLLDLQRKALNEIDESKPMNPDFWSSNPEKMESFRSGIAV